MGYKMPWGVGVSEAGSKNTSKMLLGVPKILLFDESMKCCHLKSPSLRYLETGALTSQDQGYIQIDRNSSVHQPVVAKPHLFFFLSYIISHFF